MVPPYAHHASNDISLLSFRLTLTKLLFYCLYSVRSSAFAVGSVFAFYGAKINEKWCSFFRTKSIFRAFPVSTMAFLSGLKGQIDDLLQGQVPDASPAGSREEREPPGGALEPVRPTTSSNLLSMVSSVCTSIRD